MSYQLSDKIKELPSSRIGIPYEKLIEMDYEEIETYIEKKQVSKLLGLKVLKLMDYQLKLWKR